MSELPEIIEKLDGAWRIADCETQTDAIREAYPELRELVLTTMAENLELHARLWRITHGGTPRERDLQAALDAHQNCHRECACEHCETDHEGSRGYCSLCGCIAVHGPSLAGTVDAGVGAS